MNNSRQLHLGAFMRPVSIHTAAWRYPGAYSDANFNFEHLTRFAQTLELPVAAIDAGMKKGRVAFTWKAVRSMSDIR